MKRSEKMLILGFLAVDHPAPSWPPRNAPSARQSTTVPGEHRDIITQWHNRDSEKVYFFSAGLAWQQAGRSIRR